LFYSKLNAFETKIHEKSWNGICTHCYVCAIFTGLPLDFEQNNKQQLIFLLFLQENSEFEVYHMRYKVRLFASVFL